MSTNKVEHHARICEEINKLYERKNHDYGDSFHQTFAEEGRAMARIRWGTSSVVSRPFPVAVNRKSVTSLSVTP